MEAARDGAKRYPELSKTALRVGFDDAGCSGSCLRDERRAGKCRRWLIEPGSAAGCLEKRTSRARTGELYVKRFIEERELITDYESDVKAVLARLSDQTAPIALSLLSLPEDIRKDIGWPDFDGGRCTRGR